MRDKVEEAMILIEQNAKNVEEMFFKEKTEKEKEAVREEKTERTVVTGEEFDKRFMDLLKANCCLPEGKFDRHGNSLKDLEQQKEFAVDYFTSRSFAQTLEQTILDTNEVLKKIDPTFKKDGKVSNSILDNISQCLSSDKKQELQDFERRLEKGRTWQKLLVLQQLKQKVYKEYKTEIQKDNKDLLKSLDEFFKGQEKTFNKLQNFDILLFDPGLHQELLLLGIEKPVEFISDMLRNKSISFLKEETVAYRIHVTAFLFKLLRLLSHFKLSTNTSTTDSDEVETDIFTTDSDKVERDTPSEEKTKTLFVKRKREELRYIVLNKPSHEEVRIGKEEVIIPYDKQASSGRFQPEEPDKVKPFVPFIGGISGTTKDIAELLLKYHLFEDERKYWKFQFMNAAFMILYSYHGFLEVIIKAAEVYKQYNPDKSPISKGILQYANDLSKEGKERETKDIIKDLSRYIDMEGSTVESVFPSSDSEVALPTTNSTSTSPRPGGIMNGGNTCYIASVLQVIAHTPAYYQAFPEEEGTGWKNKIREFVNLLWRGEVITRDKITEFRTLLTDDGWNGGQESQEDAEELLGFMLNKVDFKKQLIVEDQWKDSSAQPKRQLMNIYPVSNISENELQYLFDETFSPAEVKDMTEGKKRNRIRQLRGPLPDVLTLRVGNGEGKIEVNDSLRVNAEGREDWYNLTGFIRYVRRDENSGHYLSYFQQEGQWYEANDDNVTHIDRENALEEAKQAILFTFQKDTERQFQSCSKD